ncbi:MAG: class II aldolase/adducin family protein [Lautropia sp.]
MNANAAPLHDFSRTRPADLSAAEWQQRVELAACYRIIDHLGWSELIYSHTTVKVPDADHQFLINPYGLRYDEITASNLIKLDAEGNVVGASPYVANIAGFVIHSALHLARADVHCVIHTHTTAGMAVAAQKQGLLPISMYSHNFYGRVGYHDYEGPSLSLGERERLAASLGDNHALILRNHGLITVGRTIPEAFIRMFRLERACQVQLAAQAGGAELIVPTPEMCEQSARLGDQFLNDAQNQGRNPIGSQEFAALVRLIDAKDPSYRQ